MPPLLCDHFLVFCYDLTGWCETAAVAYLWSEHYITLYQAILLYWTSDSRFAWHGIVMKLWSTRTDIDSSSRLTTENKKEILLMYLNNIVIQRFWAFHPLCYVSQLLFFSANRVTAFFFFTFTFVVYLLSKLKSPSPQISLTYLCSLLEMQTCTHS